MCFFSSPKAATPAPPPPIVDTTNTTNQAYITANNNAKSKAALAYGEGSTVLTGPLNSLPPVPVSQNTLLGVT